YPPPTKQDGEKDEDYATRLKEFNDRINQLDPDGDGKHTEIIVKWELRPEAKWSDGVPVTADDYIYAFEFIMSENPAFPVQSRDAESRIKSMTSENDGMTLVVHWKESYANCVSNGHTVLPKHVVEPLVKQFREGFTNHEYNRKPLSNGPWVLSAWQAGQRMVFVPNPHWWGDKPKSPRLVVNLIAESATIAEHLRSHAVDATAQVGVNFDDATNFEREGSQGFNVYFTQGLVWEHIDCNLQDPILKDVRVRQALLFGMDRESISQSLFEGKQPVAHSWVPPLHPCFNPDAPRYNYDAERAGKLLDDAGWKLADGDSVRRNAAGDRLTITLSTTSGNRVREKVSEIIQQQWKKIGIDLKIDQVIPDTFFGAAGPLTRGTYQLGMYAWLFNSTSDGTLWTSGQIPTEANGWQGQNYPRMQNADIDRIDNLIPITLDPEARRKLFLEEQVLWSQNLPSLPLYYRTDTSITRDDFLGWRPTRGGAYVCWKSTDWAIAKPAAK
ncbi:MAG: peptide ABC transporter substrate-binding protein, partial [Planctomycetota bacterium]